MIAFEKSLSFTDTSRSRPQVAGLATAGRPMVGLESEEVGGKCGQQLCLCFLWNRTGREGKAGLEWANLNYFQWGSRGAVLSCLVPAVAEREPRGRWEATVGSRLLGLCRKEKLCGERCLLSLGSG